MRDLHALLALSALSGLACSGLAAPEAAPVQPPPVELPPVEATAAPPEAPLADPSCQEPSCVQIRAGLAARSVDGALVVGDLRLADGLLRGVELDGDPATEVLVSRDCGGNGCVPDWTVIDCKKDAACVELPALDQEADVRLVYTGAGARGPEAELCGVGPGRLRCVDLVAGRIVPRDTWTAASGDVRQTFEAGSGEHEDGAEVAAGAIDLDDDGTAERVSCTWWERWGLLNCTVTVRGHDVTLPSASKLEILTTRTDGVLDVRANDELGRWDGQGWFFRR